MLRPSGQPRTRRPSRISSAPASVSRTASSRRRAKICVWRSALRRRLARAEAARKRARSVTSCDECAVVRAIGRLRLGATTSRVSELRAAPFQGGHVRAAGSLEADFSSAQSISKRATLTCVTFLAGWPLLLGWPDGNCS